MPLRTRVEGPLNASTMRPPPSAVAEDPTLRRSHVLVVDDEELVPTRPRAHPGSLWLRGDLRARRRRGHGDRRGGARRSRALRRAHARHQRPRAGAPDPRRRRRPALHRDDRLRHRRAFGRGAARGGLLVSRTSPSRVPSTWCAAWSSRPSRRAACAARTVCSRASFARATASTTWWARAPRCASVLDLVDKVAESDSTVLITGESGTGKELIARAIHYNSRRADRVLVSLNCGAIPEELLESELFGHVKGAFTGAVAHREGPLRGGRRRHDLPRRDRRHEPEPAGEAAARPAGAQLRAGRDPRSRCASTCA